MHWMTSHIQVSSGRCVQKSLWSSWRPFDGFLKLMLKDPTMSFSVCNLFQQAVVPMFPQSFLGDPLLQILPLHRKRVGSGLWWRICRPNSIAQTLRDMEIPRNIQHWNRMCRRLVMGRALDDLELSDGPLRVGCFSNDRAENQMDKNQNEQQEKCLRHLETSKRNRDTAVQMLQRRFWRRGHLYILVNPHSEWTAVENPPHSNWEKYAEGKWWVSFAQPGRWYLSTWITKIENPYSISFGLSMILTSLDFRPPILHQSRKQPSCSTNLSCQPGDFPFGWHPLLQALLQKANEALEPQLKLLVRVLLDAEKVGAVLPVLETRTFAGVRDWILNNWWWPTLDNLGAGSEKSWDVEWGQEQKYSTGGYIQDGRTLNCDWQAASTDLVPTQIQQNRQWDLDLVKGIDCQSPARMS